MTWCHRLFLLAVPIALACDQGVTVSPRDVDAAAERLRAARSSAIAARSTNEWLVSSEDHAAARRVLAGLTKDDGWALPVLKTMVEHGDPLSMAMSVLWRTFPEEAPSTCIAALSAPGANLRAIATALGQRGLSTEQSRRILDGECSGVMVDELGLLARPADGTQGDIGGTLLAVAHVCAEGAAARSGVSPADVIVGVNGKRLRGPELFEALDGEVAQLTIMRGGAVVEVDITMRIQRK